MTDTSPDNHSFKRKAPSPRKGVHPALGDLANGMNGSLAISTADILELTDHMNATLDRMSGLVRQMENCMDGTRLLHEKGMPNAEDVSTHMKIAAASVRALALEMRDIAGAATVVSSQMLSKLGKSLQKTVAQLALAQAESKGDIQTNGATAK